jgi:hypothetical protein
LWAKQHVETLQEGVICVTQAIPWDSFVDARLTEF